MYIFSYLFFFFFYFVYGIFPPGRNIYIFIKSDLTLFAFEHLEFLPRLGRSPR